MNYKTYEVRIYNNGDKHWYLNGELHREGGPAIECNNGYKAWYLNGRSLSEGEFLRKVGLVKELTVGQISKLLGYEVKVVK